MPNDTAPAWPDPARPGMPLNAEKDGWHWLTSWLLSPNWEKRMPWCGLWNAKEQAWVEVESDGDGNMESWSPRRMSAEFGYLGPCLTPSEQSAREAAAAVAMRERAADYVAECLAELGLPFGVESIRAIPIDTTAMDRLLAEARADERAKILAAVEAEPDVGLSSDAAEGFHNGLARAEAIIRARSTPA